MENFKRKLAEYLRLLALSIPLLFGLTASAGINEWTNLGPEGGGIYQVIYHRALPTTIYALARSGFYRSIDGGASWHHPAMNTLADPNSIVVDPSDPDRIYFIAYQRLYASLDRGVTFVELPRPVGITLALSVSSDGAVYVVNNALQVYRSTSQGQSWEQRGLVTATPGNPGQFVTDPNNPNLMYLQIFGEGLFASTDGGGSWVRRGLSSPADLGFATHITIDPQGSSRIWTLALVSGVSRVLLSNDYGDTWSIVYSASNGGADSPSVIALDPSNSMKVYIGLSNGNILTTQNQGADWNIIGNRGEFISTLAVNPLQANQLLVGSDSGLSIGTVGAASWTSRNSGLIASSAYGMETSDINRTIYFISDAGIFYGDGNSVSPVNNAALKQLMPQWINPVVLHVQAGSAGTIFVSNGDRRFAKSTDGGNTWAALPNLPDQVLAIVSTASDAQTLYAGTYDGVLKSTDGGSHWSSSRAGLPATEPPPSLSQKSSIYTLAAHSHSLIYAGTLGGGVYKTTDAGNMWVAANTGIENRRISDLEVDPNNDQIVFAANEKVVSRTTNGGATWVDVTVPLEATSGEYFYAVRIDPTNSRIVYALTRDRILRSIDSGASWQILRLPPPAFRTWGMAALIVSANYPQDVFIGTLNDGVQKITPASDLALSMNAPASMKTGVESSYTLNIQNNGPWDVTSVRATIQLPSSAMAVTASSNLATCSTLGTSVTCILSEMRRNTVVPLTVLATPSATGSFLVTASVQSAQADVNSSNNAISDAKSVTSDTSSSSSSSASNTSGGGGGSLSIGLLLMLTLVSTLQLANQRPGYVT